jgi:ABC-type sugar transport system substrate-binding protein
MRVLQDWALAKRPLLLSFDYRPSFEDDLRRGDLYLMVVQDAYQMGYQAVQRAVQAQSDQKIPAQIMVDFLVVSAANVNDPDIRLRLGHHHD